MVKKGYKQTEIGVIPEDWEVRTFKDVSVINQGLQVAISKRLTYPNNDAKIYITIQYLNNNKTKEYINNYNQKVVCNKDDILLTRTGNTGIVVSGVEGVFHNNFFKINYDRNVLIKKYLIYYLKSNFIQIIIRAKAGTSTIPDLNHNDFYSIPVLIPQKSEQKAIATALSDVDNLISSLEDLITKKEHIKTATMQQLLTGKKRLDGFSGEWVEKKLGEIGKTYNGLSGKTKKDFGVGNAKYIPFLNVIKNIIVDIKSLEKVTIGSSEQQNKVMNGDLLFNTSSEVPEEVGMCALMNSQVNDLYLNSFCFGYRIYNRNISPLFLSYLINSNMGRYIFSLLAQGATRYNLSKENFNDIKLLIPPTLEEQQAIAQILSDMDKEIDVLKDKLNKTKAIKMGMMQELLMGKTRLKGETNGNI